MFCSIEKEDRPQAFEKHRKNMPHFDRSCTIDQWRDHGQLTQKHRHRSLFACSNILESPTRCSADPKNVSQRSFVFIREAPGRHRLCEVGLIDVNPLLFFLVYLPSTLSCAAPIDPEVSDRYSSAVCASLLMLCASSGRAGSGVRIL